MPEKPIPSMSELEALLNSKEPAAVLNAILGNTPSGAVIVRAPDGRVLRVSDYTARLFKRSREELENHVVADAQEHLPAFDGAGRPLQGNDRPLGKALRGEVVDGVEYWMEAANGELIPCVCNASPIRNSRGELIGAISSYADMRRYKALEQSLREAMVQKEILYRELAHRVKNHLQVMTALVALEASKSTLSAKELGDEIIGQLQTLAAVYKVMERANAGDRVEARTFVEEVCRPYRSETVGVEAAVLPPDLTLTSEQAAPVGMLVNEAVCNSRKHAFSEQGGHIQVNLRRVEPGHLRLEVIDDGKGWGPVEPDDASHGLDLMRLLARQLRCELELSERPNGGVMVAVELPEIVECLRPDLRQFPGVSAPAQSPAATPSEDPAPPQTPGTPFSRG